MADDEILQELQRLNRKVDRLQAELDTRRRQLEPLESLAGDFGGLLNEIMGTLVSELDELADYFTYDDLLFLLKKVLRNTRNFTKMLEYLEAGMDLMVDAHPIANEAFIDSLYLLDDFERKGYFRFARMMFEVMETVVPAWSEAEIERFGEHIVSLAFATMQMSNPEELAKLEKAGIWRVLWNSRSREVREGMAFLTRFLYLAHPGRGNEARGAKLIKRKDGTKHE